MQDNEIKIPNEETSNGQGKKKSGLVTCGMVLGIVAISTSFIPIINNLSFVMGVLALIFGAIGLAKKLSKGKAITAFVLGILAVVITLIMQSALDSALDEVSDDLDYMSGGKTQEILDEYVDIEIGKFNVIEGEYYNDTELVVNVTNKSDERKSFDIQVEAVDSSGKRIDVDYIYANDLGAGQSQDFKIFTLVTDENIQAMKSAKIKIVEISMY